MLFDSEKPAHKNEQAVHIFREDASDFAATEQSTSINCITIFTNSQGKFAKIVVSILATLLITSLCGVNKLAPY